MVRGPGQHQRGIPALMECEERENMSSVDGEEEDENSKRGILGGADNTRLLSV